MHPLLTVLHLGDRAVPIGSYGALLCVAIAVAAGAALGSARALRLDPGAAIAAIGVTTLGAFAGGYALHALVQWARLGSLTEALARPGMTIVGALAVGALAASVAGRLLQLPVGVWADRALPGLLLALAVGRVGCLLGGCCYGAQSALPWAVRYTDPLAPAAALDVTRHPVPLYEALCALALALVLQRVRAGRPHARLCAALLGYACARALLEGLRADAVRGEWLLGISTAQVACAVAAALACLVLWSGRRTQARRALA